MGINEAITEELHKGGLELARREIHEPVINPVTT
jgi:hypothetical protein